MNESQQDQLRLILAFAATMVVYIVYVSFFAAPHQSQPQPAAAPMAVTEPSASATAATTLAPAVGPSPGTSATPTGARAAAPATLGRGGGALLVLEDPAWRQLWEGNVLRRWRLAHYRAAVSVDSEPVDLCAAIEACVVVGFRELGAPNWARREVGERPRLRFGWDLPDGAVATVTLQPLVDYRVAVVFRNEGSKPLRPVVRLETRVRERTRYNFAGMRFRRAGETEKVSFGDLSEPRTWDGRYDWIAWDDKYFARVVLPPPDEVRVRVDALPEDPEPGTPTWFEVELPAVGGQYVERELQLFGGPKEMALLRRLGRGLYELIDYGWTGFLARPLLAILHLFYRLLGNYGWAIVLLTLAIKILLYPLTRGSFRSMQKMAQLKPKMEDLKEKYKDDPQRFQRELMDLYRRERVNPLGGCLPILLQIPIFFALYNVLLFSIELRHAPFVGWIVDLSAPETLMVLSLAGFSIPLRVLPLLMGIAMVVQQKLTPTATVDPIQQRIFMIMPVMMTVLFYGFPSGLVLYWFTNNVISILQQWWIRRQMEAT